MWREGAVGVATWLAVSAAGCGGAPGRDDAPDASGFADLPPVGYAIDVPRPSDVPRVDPPCHPGQVRCGSTGSCYDVSTNRENCGSCGRVCDPREQCVAGVCASLGVDEAYCGRQVVHLDSDPRNCGSCYRVCGFGEDCAGGVCGAIDAGHAGDAANSDATVGDVPRDVPPDARLELPAMTVDNPLVRSGEPAGPPSLRPRWPMTDAHVGSRRPRLRWVRPADVVGPVEVTLCRDRALTVSCVRFEAMGEEGRPDAELAPGRWYWRPRAGGRVGATWAVRVPTATIHDRAWGGDYDADGDGRADVVARVGRELWWQGGVLKIA